MIEYIDEIHTYLYNGMIIPSVSEIISKLYPNKYKNIPKIILKKKAEYGSKVHKIIEDLENGKSYEIDSVYIELAIKEYLKIKDKYKLNVLEQEEIVCYKGLYAGRFDMTANISDELSLCDIKTTAELDKEYLSWQLSMYELAYGMRFDKLYCIWLPKGGLGKLIEIKRKDETKILELIKGE